jgi:hypothetical protein
MIKMLGKLSLAGVLAAIMLGAVAQSYAADSTNAPAAPTKNSRFRGTLSAVDNTAKTITVDNKTEKGRVFAITSDTKLIKDGKPAMLSDAVVGEPVNGTYTTGDDGKMTAKMVRFGAPARKPASTN